MDSESKNDKYNADELVVPNWLNGEFFREVLSNVEKEPNIRIIDIQMSPATAKGDHYASIMFRSKISYETRKGKFFKSLIIKTMPEQEGHKKEMLSNSPIFETEIGMYTKALPKFQEILRKSGDNTRLCVPCLYHSLEPRQVMIFEDLVEKGYTVIRNRGGTIEELKAAYAKLAKMQAVSFHILHENPEYLQEFKNGINAMPNLMNDPFMTTGVTNLLELIETVPELSKYKPYFKSIEQNYLKSFVDIMEEYRLNRRTDGYYVLCHGDYHLRNIMVKHNPADGSLEDCMLLDFQMSHVCPISTDLLYSIYLLMDAEQRRHNYKELIKFYFSTFVEALEKIGFNGELPNCVDFWRQLHRHKIFDIFYLTILPMVFAIESNAFDIGDVVANHEIRKKLFFQDKYIDELKYLLPRFEKLGYFN
ncbi:uncharacterized protein LOC117792425 [Drosophila innubila]|uniref:uncharacterized protein LOC117792425 n=1 Tax=Drosophila innubila TaxID=198719 RepID=UPI00148CFA0D|nr:uncharacterized protein LOC117792425 [Drosophila innubila]